MAECAVLLSRLHGIRRTIRRRLFGYGVSATLGGAVGAFLALLIIDWLLWLPAALRVVVDLTFLTLTVGAAIRWIIVPQRAMLGIGEVAGELERRFPSLRDQLSSAVSLVGNPQAGSTGMIRHVVAGANRVAGELPLETSLTRRPLWNSVAGLLLGVAVLTATAVGAPGWLQTGLCRYLDPLGKVEWPRSVQIVPLSGVETVAIGDSVTVCMAIERGLSPNLRGVLHFRDSHDVVTSLTMRRDEGKTFCATIDAVTETLEYWFEAGDDSTADHPFTIQAVPRPEVVEALAEVVPPAYATNRTPRTYDLNGGMVQAHIGGRVNVLVRTSKPVVPDPTEDGVGLRLESGELVPLVVKTPDRQELSAELDVTSDVHFRIELRDEHGFTNRGGAQYLIQALPDRPPGVTLLEPTSTVEVTPQGSVKLLAQVEDDFGVTRLELAGKHTADEPAAMTVSLEDRQVVVGGGDSYKALMEYTWPLEPLKLVPGDGLWYTVEAVDNRKVAEQQGQIGRSAPQRIEVISQAEFDSRVGEKLGQLEKHLRRALLEETELVDATGALLAEDSTASVSRQTGRGSPGELAGRQARLARRVRHLGRQADELRIELVRNRVKAEGRDARMAELRDTLERIATEPMTAAAGALADVGGQSEAGSSRETILRSALDHESTAAAQIRQVLQTMTQWGSFQGVLARTRDVLDRQTDLRTQTADMGKSTLGRSIADLTSDEQVALKRLAHRQNQIADDVVQLLARLEGLVRAADEGDPSGAEAAEAAARAARAGDLSKRVQSAAQAVEENRTAAATIDQKVAVDVMQKMVATLEEREDRELARLRRRLQRAEDQIDALIDDQQALHAATQEALAIKAPDSALIPLEQQQGTLERNTRLLAGELEDATDVGDVAIAVRHAAAPMKDAETRLVERKLEPAGEAQAEALMLLRAARAQLEALAQAAAERELRRSLAHIREALESLLSNQQEISARVEKLAAEIDERGRVARAQAREASQLARKQVENRLLLSEYLPTFALVPVYQWALDRVGRWMDDCGRQLSRREVTPELASRVSRIARELQRLVDAFDELETLPKNTEFAEAEGGGAGQQGMTKPVPALAELLVLRSMQREINERTRAVAQAIGTDDPEEGKLREIKTLGEDQA
ncbi:MAG: hypothetical protein KJ749_00315, partial [Planctomycetes bacterium]|nr:hypothetical protein [Planctomycetota bacterium]